MEIVTCYTEKLLIAVVLNDYEMVKSILQSGDYNKNLLVDVGGFEVPVPVTYFNKCWRIILDFPFQEDLYRKQFEIEDTTNCLDLCGTECSYQATCMAGELLRSPGWYSNGIEIDELGSLLRWAANEKMYTILSQTHLYVD